MGYENCGSSPNSKAALNKGMNVSKLTHIDTKTHELANIILDEEVQYNGEKMAVREAILRQQVTQAIAGDLRACQFLIELAGRAVSPLEQLRSMMVQGRPDDRRRKTSQ